MRFNYEATGIGSVPFKDPKEALRIIYERFGQIPFWPQLPKRSFLENMYVQFSEELPGLVLDEANKTIHIDTSDVAAKIEEVYGRYLEKDIEFFKMSEKHAPSFYQFLEILKVLPGKVKFAKGHITGPISYALAVTDQNKRAIIHDKDLFEVLTKNLAMKAKWQIRKIKKAFPSVILFIDEPYLVSIGSSYVTINIENALERLDELIRSAKEEGALVGIHCCGNTDFGLLLKRDIDIMSFDAYNFMKEFSLYSGEIKSFLAKGKTIAWGMVPSSDAIEKESVKSLVERWKSILKLLAEKGVAQDDISSLITPSCGVGTLDEAVAVKILELTGKLSGKLQK